MQYTTLTLPILDSDLWDAPQRYQRIQENVTVAGTYNISAQLCTPLAAGTKSLILQILTHGLIFDKQSVSTHANLALPDEPMIGALTDAQDKILGC